MYPTHRSLIYVMMIVTIVVLPTAVTLGWYQFTRDPNLRPLGITREALREFGETGDGFDLVAYVDWPAHAAESPARRQLADNLLAAFASKGVVARLEFRNASGPPQITYVVGKSIIGPYPTNRASDGISAAVDAYRMQ